MSQRNSGYERKEADNYATPAWVTRALLPHIPDRIAGHRGRIWEPAAGEGAMANVLRENLQAPVIATDIRPGNGMPTWPSSHDFLQDDPVADIAAIITNPPFYLAQEFIERALELTRPVDGFVAMLLRADFDHAKGRSHLFQDGPFAKRLALTRRIVWFVDPLTGRPKASPSVNHSWFIFDHRHLGPATIAYYVERAGAREGIS